LAQSLERKVQQTESETTRHASIGRSWYLGTEVPRAGGYLAKPFDPAAAQSTSNAGLWRSIPVAALSTLLFVVTLPFRVVFWTIAWLGRIAVSALGFVFMVLGIVLWAGTSWFLGILLFLVGLVLLLRSLH
jgi:hypothetical protein